MTSTVTLIVGFVFQLLCLLFWVRFLLQACKADFYNPLSQAVAKATDPVCKPLRYVVPSVGRFDLASVLVAVVIACLGTAASVWLDPRLSGSVGAIVLTGIVQALMVLTNFYFFAILIVVLASFIAPGNYNPALGLLQQILEPIMAPIRKVLPTLGPFDLSPMVVILLIFIVQSLLASSL